MNIKQYYIAIATVLVFSACEKEVTEIKPTDLLASDLAFSTAQKAENSVIGAYNSLQSAEFLSGRALIYVDLMGEDIYDKGAFFGDLPRFNLLSNSGFAANVWTAAYASIASANRAAAGVSGTSVLSAQKQKELIAETKFIRAIAHFYLVNYFAQPYVFTADASHPGVPIITENFTSNDPAANKPRSTVAQVYTAVIADLTAALADLPTAYSTTYQTKTRATKAAAAALLARVYLYKADYANARTTAVNIINGQYGSFSLRPTPNGAFGPNNYMTAETIWSIPNNANDNPNTNNALPQHYFPNGRGDLAISASFRNTTTNPYFASDDRRRTTMIINGSGANASAFFTNKYPDVATRADWSPVLRYAEVLLIAAEASAQLGATGADPVAIGYLNQVRDRSRVSAPQYTIASFITKQALIDAILGERRIELAFEGHRFWDLMRNKLSVTNKYDNDGASIIAAQPFGANKSIWPIPQAEVDKSKGTLVQNPGY
jgi:hypothetical protein